MSLPDCSTEENGSKFLGTDQSTTRAAVQTLIKPAVILSQKKAQEDQAGLSIRGTQSRIGASITGHGKFEPPVTVPFFANG